MNTNHLSSMVFLVIFFLFPLPEIFAHGEGHNPKEEKVEAPAAIDSLYSVKESQTTPPLEADNDLDNIFSPTDLFTEDELSKPMLTGNKKMQGNHSEHEKTKVQLSRHEWVSFSSKGFGTALGIALFVGLAFARLTFMRPGE